MNISFVGKNPKSVIEPFNSPMVLAQSNSSPSEGFFFPMPTGENNGDIPYWNPSAGPSGAWVKLASPTIASGEESKTLSHNGSTLFWDEASALPDGTQANQILYWNGEEWVLLNPPASGSVENPSFLKFTGSLDWGEGSGLPNGQNKGDLLQWDPAAGEGGAWVILAAPEDKGSMLYWTGDAWQFLEPPSGSTLHVLTVQNGNLSWTATQDC